MGNSLLPNISIVFTLKANETAQIDKKTLPQQPVKTGLAFLGQKFWDCLHRRFIKNLLKLLIGQAFSSNGTRVKTHKYSNLSNKSNNICLVLNGLLHLYYLQMSKVIWLYEFLQWIGRLKRQGENTVKCSTTRKGRVKHFGMLFRAMFFIN